MSHQIFIGKLIQEELRRQQRTVVWLAQSLKCNRTNIYKIFHRPNIDTDLLLQISLLLDCDFFRIYSRAFASDRQTPADPAPQQPAE